MGATILLGLLKKFAPLIIVAGLLIGAIWYVGSLKESLQSAEANEILARSDAEAQAAAVTVLRSHAAQVEAAAHVRDATLQTIRKQLRDTQTSIIDMRKRDAVYGSWADTRHPDAVRDELRQAAAATP